MEELLKKYVEGAIVERLTTRETKLASQAIQLEEQCKQIEELSATAAIRKHVIEKLEEKCDDNEQYSRRTSVRLHGVELKEKKENVND